MNTVARCVRAPPHHVLVCVCVHVRACVRACVCVRACACVRVRACVPQGVHEGVHEGAELTYVCSAGSWLGARDGAGP